VGLVLSAGGVAVAFFGAQAGSRGVAFWVALAAFSLIVIATILVHWPVVFAWDFDGYRLVRTYVDQTPPAADDFVMRELAVHAMDGYLLNQRHLRRLEALQSLALLAFGVEIAALLINLAAR
jgi:hypothetical protein